MITPESQLEQPLIDKLVTLKYDYRPDIRDRPRSKQTSARSSKPSTASSSPTANSSACSTRSSPPTSSPPPAPSASGKLHPRRRHPAELHAGQHQGLVQKHTSRSSTSSASTPTTATTAMTSSCSSTACPLVQIELKTLGISPRRAMQQIVDYKNDPGNGYTNTLLCFVQLFIVSNRDRHLLLRQQQRPPLQLQRRRALPAHLPVRRPKTTRRSPTSTTSPRTSWPSARSAR